MADHEGGCVCGEVRFKLTDTPLIVHCCHCRWCQRETGSAFALNAMIESNRIVTLNGHPEKVKIPSESGKGQKILRCPTCRIALWSHYAGADEALSFVRVGTLDSPDQLPPDAHIFTSSRQSWLKVSDGKPEFLEFYRKRDVWRKEALERLQILMGKA